MTDRKARTEPKNQEQGAPISIVRLLGLIARKSGGRKFGLRLQFFSFPERGRVRCGMGGALFPRVLHLPGSEENSKVTCASSVQ
jgi:hypothetical protein